MSHHIIKMCVKRDTSSNMDIVIQNWMASFAHVTGGQLVKGVRLLLHCLISISIFQNKLNDFAIVNYVN